MELSLLLAGINLRSTESLSMSNSKFTNRIEIYYCSIHGELQRATATNKKESEIAATQYIWIFYWRQFTHSSPVTEHFLSHNSSTFAAALCVIIAHEVEVDSAKWCVDNVHRHRRTHLYARINSIASAVARRQQTQSKVKWWMAEKYCDYNNMQLFMNFHFFFIGMWTKINNPYVIG